MGARLTELLERIRPAGAPGAAAVGTGPTDPSAAELAELTTALASFEAEADRLVATAGDEIVGLRQAAERDVARVQADLGERVAAAGVEATQVDDERRAREVERLDAETAREIDRRRRAAVSSTDALVASVLDRIWSFVDENGREDPR